MNYPKFEKFCKQFIQDNKGYSIEQLNKPTDKLLLKASNNGDVLFIEQGTNKFIMQCADKKLTTIHWEKQVTTETDLYTTLKEKLS